MAAPSGVVWGSTVGSYGRIGLYINVTTNNDTTYAGDVQVWFWSKYSVSDTSNTLYFDNLSASGSATTSKGALSVKTTVATGSGWSTTNQVKLASYNFSYSKGTSAVTRYLYSKLVNIDRVGGTMYISGTLLIPQLASYTVTYNLNGGSGSFAKQTKYYGKSLILHKEKPTRSGYSFLGWALSEGGAKYYNAGAQCDRNENLSLWAVWQPNTYTVTYNANGGVLGNVTNQTKTHDVALPLDTDTPTRTNYNFLGWATSASATTAAYKAGGSYTTNAPVTLYAVWELAYTKPQISGLMLSRYDSESGEVADNGTSALVSFSWKCNYAVSSITIEWKLANSSQYAASDKHTVTSASGTIGAVNVAVAIGAITEKAYTFRIIVADSQGDTTKIVSLPGAVQHIDFLAPETEDDKGGASIGKVAELQGVFDVAYKTRPLGGFMNIPIEANTDFDDLKTPNTYVSYDKVASTYVNCPIVGGTFTLHVASGGNEGQVSQTLTTTSKEDFKVFVRHYHSSNGAFNWGDWHLIYSFKGTVLWDGSTSQNGGWNMNAAQTLTLSQPISEQPSGIVLVFQAYKDAMAQPNDFNTFFIPKRSVMDNGGKGRDFLCTTTRFGYVGLKYIYISDTTLTGHASNIETGTAASGITYTNGYFVLTKVYGV